MQIGSKRTVGRAAVICASIATLSLLAASAASAATFCVPAHPGCTPSGGGGNHSDLQDAFNAANNIPGKDTVDLGPATLIHAAAGAGNPVDVVGEGPGVSVIQSPGTQTAPLLSIEAPTSTVSGLSIVLGDADQFGLVLWGTGSNLEVGGSSTADELGIRVIDDGSSPDGGILRDSRVTLPTGGSATSSTGIEGFNPGVVVERVQVEAATGVRSSGLFRRASVRAGETGFDAGPSMRLDHATVRLLDSTGTALGSQATADASSTLTAQHVTAVGAGAGTGVSVRGSCDDSDARDAAATLRNTIVRGFATDVHRQGAVCGFPPTEESAEARVNVAHSILDGLNVTSAGPGSLTPGPGNINIDPLFAGADDFHLQPGSPAIDAGDPAAPGTGELDVDFDGNPRTLDGNGDGVARRDIGAFEFLPDSDGDGVPDLRDACPGVAAQTQDGCPAPDGGTGGNGDGDVNGPGITLGGKAKQKADGSIEVKVTVDEASTATGEGTVVAKAPAGGKSAARARKKNFTLKPATLSLGAGETGTLKLRLKKKATRFTAAALKRGGKASAKIIVSATDLVGNASQAPRGVRLKPAKKR